MTPDQRDLRRRRLLWLSLLAFTFLAYPMLLLGSSYIGSGLGMLRDVNASRALARALSYAADPRFPLEPGNDGALATAALDANLVALQLTDGLPPGVSPFAAPAIGGTPPTDSGGVNVGVTPSPDPTALPSPDPTASPSPDPSPSPSPAPSPTASPTPSPTPCSGLPPVGSGSFDGTVFDAQNKSVLAATVSLFWCGHLVGSAVTGINGRFVIPGLAPTTSYSYTFAALGHPQGSGSFVSAASGNSTHNLHF